MDFILEGNSIGSCPYEYNDMGAYYHGGSAGGYQYGWTQTGNVIRGNTWRSVKYIGRVPQTLDYNFTWNGLTTQAIYLDDGHSGYTVRDNHFVDVEMGIVLGGGRRHTVVDNTFASCLRACVHIDNRGMNWAHELCGCQCSFGTCKAGCKPGAAIGPGLNESDWTVLNQSDPAGVKGYPPFRFEQGVRKMRCAGPGASAACRERLPWLQDMLTDDTGGGLCAPAHNLVTNNSFDASGCPTPWQLCGFIHNASDFTLECSLHPSPDLKVVSAWGAKCEGNKMVAAVAKADDDDLTLAAAVPVPAGTLPLPAPTQLRVENLPAPVAVISEPSPRFSFLHGPLPEPSFGVTQASYRITVAVASSGAQLWDSGSVTSSNCSQIEYNGTALAPYTRFLWTAEWTSSRGGASARATSYFETGPMNVSDWRGAGWLVGRPRKPPNGPPHQPRKPWPEGRMQLRADFAMPAGQVAFARVFVAATGCAHVELNGEVPQPDLRGVCPWPAGHLDAVRYVTHNVTALLAPGKKNALGLCLGQVMAGKVAAPFPSQALVLLVVKWADEGSEPFFFSSGADGWQAAESYVDGGAWTSTVDWTKRETGWSTAAFTPDPTRWQPVNATPTTVATRALSMPVSAALSEVRPSAVQRLSDSAFLYTFPKNFVGQVRLAPLPSAATNSSLTVLLGEWLDPPPPPPGKRGPGSGPRVFPTTATCCGNDQQYQNHILVNGNSEPLTTLFAWHGFQYVRVDSANHTGFTGTLDAIVGLEIHTNISSTGSLSFGAGTPLPSAGVEQAAEVLTHVNSMTRNSQLSNVAAGMPTDCPTRESKLL